jgi:hypothetical protein
MFIKQRNSMVKSERSKGKMVMGHAPVGVFGVVGFVGAFVYFANTAHNAGEFLFAFVQALVWPGILVYHVLLALHA